MGQFAMTEWYGQIEEPVRALVKVLRNNGFNTVSSCGHSNPYPSIQMEWYGSDDEARRLYNLLHDTGYSRFEIRCIWPSSGVGRFMEVSLFGDR